MLELNEGDILTKVTRYNLIRDQRMLYIDVHERIAGNLAGRYLAVPNLINIVAKQQHQGVGETESEAIADCLQKIRGLGLLEIFPEKNE
jgi:hypothetical protein